jgi:hypothetical protein
VYAHAHHRLTKAIKSEAFESLSKQKGIVHRCHSLFHFKLPYDPLSNVSGCGFHTGSKTLNRVNLKAALALALSLCATQPLCAQETPSTPSGARRFTLADFNQYSPVSALDMVERIAGFSIASGDDKRGFGDNAGNVLIDGDRPSSKSEGIYALLSRIPASEVDYIELIESAGGDGEARGKAQIVNVVRKKSSKISGTFNAGTTIGEREGLNFFGDASASVQRGATKFELNIGRYDEDVFGRGGEDFYDGRRVLQERRTYFGNGGYGEYTLGGAIKSKIGSAKINLNAKAKWNAGFDDRNGAITSPLGVATGLEVLTSKAPESDFGYEVGGDIEFPLTPKLTTKMIGLYRTGDDTSRNRVDTSFVSRPATSFAVFNINRPTEAIYRIQNDWAAFKSHSVQFGVEFAFNQLDAKFSGSSTSGGVLTPFTPSNVLVREVRIEPFLSDVWSISPSWKLEGGVVFEASRLALKGDSTGRRSFKFAKPRLIGTWTLDKATSFEFRAEREISQLDFNEFATSVDLAAGGQVDAGNADLVPEKTTSVSALVRHKFFDRGSIQFKAEYQFVSDTQDLVPVTVRDAQGNIVSRFDGTGNIGSSRRWNGELEITLPFDWFTKPLGITGMELKYVGHYHGSRAVDPVTGLNRSRSGAPLWHQNWDFRHDVGKTGFAWGVSANARAINRQYFINQFRTTYETPDISIFAEYKKFKFGTLRFEAQDATRSTFLRNRFFYQDTRASGILTSSISRERRLDRRFQISLSGKF